jgi:outer membrane protein TolC
MQAAETLTWQQCFDEAKQVHPDLYSALASVQQSEAEKRITRGALLPRLTSSINTRESGSTENGVPSSSAYSYSLSAQQLLFDGHKTSNMISSNEEAIKAARQNYHAVSADVRYALRAAFTELLKAQDLLGLTMEIADRRRMNVSLINLRYNGGREHVGSLGQARADLAQAEFEVFQAQRGLVLAQSKLASALGRDAHTPVRVRGSFSSVRIPPGIPSFELLAKNNPLFQQLDMQRKAARYDLNAARSACSPELYLTSSVGRGTVDSLPFDALDWNAGVTLSVPIYEGGTGRAKVSRAIAVVSQRNAEEKSGYLQILDTLEEKWKNFLDAFQMVTVKKKNLAAAIERSTISNAQYSNGLVSFNEWVIIENNLVSAKKEFLNAEAALLIAEAQWIQAKGEGFDG